MLKFNASDVRGSDAFGHLADADESDFEPAVILGSRKVAKSRDWPLGFAFLQFEQSARRARTVVIAGYSFRDQAVNERLRAAAQGAERRWIVINRKTGQADAAAYAATVEPILAPARPDFIFTGFEVSVANVSRVRPRHERMVILRV